MNVTPSASGLYAAPAAVSVSRATPLSTLAKTSSAQVTPKSPASAVLVSLSRAPTPADIQTYTIFGSTTTAWSRPTDDAVSSLMAGNFGLPSLTARFSGLGAAMLKRFESDVDDFSQSVTFATPGASAVAPADLLAAADNRINLSIKTAGGATVELSLASQADGMAVQVAVSGGELNESERKALADLSGAFQDAIDGLNALPPKLALEGLTNFNTKELLSIDFKASLKTDGKGAIQAVDFHADSRTRALSASGPSGTVKVDVDLSQPAILGSAPQQARAIARYLQQVDMAGGRGRGDAALVSMFKDAFSQLNSNYGEKTALPGHEAPTAISLNAGDHGLLSGLADFNASMTQVPDASNPMRPDEVDTFRYTLSQKTSVSGKDPRNRTIHQDRQAELDASFHRALSPGAQLLLTAAKESQFYEFVQISDQANASTDISYEDGTRTRASVGQSARQSTHVQRYLMAKLESDTVQPEEGMRVNDLRLLLSIIDRAEMSDDPDDARQRDQALEAAAAMAGLPDGPAMLR
ncbi:hypothetical protein EJO68_33295 [Variovorax atrisoli]|uniref:hypothetical protein n=1 Tax=Variovorax atrisoli TaxID=3394203 RepID=UPI000F7DD405|nr:hypothetical protein [Variovorax sp. 369]RTD84015.1 hypothetical protein EJO68_33295 [Variovorax sp. 369]